MQCDEIVSAAHVVRLLFGVLDFLPRERAKTKEIGDNPILYYTFSLECDTLHSYSSIYRTGAVINAFAYASHSFSISVVNT